jgi:hypothetical protein
LESGVKRRKEVLFGDVGYVCLYYLFDLFAVCRFERVEISNIERLEDVRRVGRYIKGDDVVVFVVEFEVGRVVVVVAVEDEETMNPNCSSFGMFVEMLNLF